MKKYIIVLILFLIILNFNNNEQMVVQMENSEYAMYILEFPNLNISTNNINKFENIKIIWIKPYINKIYKDKIKYNVYYFEDISLNSNINKFTNKFIDLLQKNGYINDALNYKISGIRINKMKVYCNETTLINLNIEGMKYKKEEIYYEI